LSAAQRFDRWREVGSLRVALVETNGTLGAASSKRAGHRTPIHFSAASRASMSALDSHRPLTMTPAIRELFAMFVSF
jgi:DNA-binding IclR family transcriptional regulator